MKTCQIDVSAMQVHFITTCCDYFEFDPVARELIRRSNAVDFVTVG